MVLEKKGSEQVDVHEREQGSMPEYILTVLRGGEPIQGGVIR